MMNEFQERRERLQRILQIGSICNPMFLIPEERAPEKKYWFYSYGKEDDK